MSGLNPAPAPCAPAVAGKQPFDRSASPYCYVLVRTDLSVEQQMVQAIHAAMAAAAGPQGVPSETRLALLAVPDQDALLDHASRLHQAGVPFHLFEEPDHGIGASALATQPGPALRLPCLRRLPTWKANVQAGGCTSRGLPGVCPA